METQDQLVVLRAVAFRVEAADGGAEGQCGWCTDRFGVSWQVTPARMGDLLGGDDPQASQRAMRAMFGMSRLVIADLEAARAG